jgi:redox-sensitive bicupin YhaK (pirin superfamily)
LAESAVEGKDEAGVVSRHSRSRDSGDGVAGRRPREGDRGHGRRGERAHQRSRYPLYLDLQLQPGQRFEQAVSADHTAFAYAYEGGALVGDGEDARELPRQAAGVLSEGERVVVTAGDEGARLILIAGKPIREPVVQYGPFVMNTREEIEQAIADYQRGDFARAAA